jgi:hypothetical protein
LEQKANKKRSNSLWNLCFFQAKIPKGYVSKYVYVLIMFLFPLLTFILTEILCAYVCRHRLPTPPECLIWTNFKTKHGGKGPACPGIKNLTTTSRVAKVIKLMWMDNWELLTFQHLVMKCVVQFDWMIIISTLKWITNQNVICMHSWTTHFQFSTFQIFEMHNFQLVNLFKMLKHAHTSTVWIVNFNICCDQ